MVIEEAQDGALAFDALQKAQASGSPFTLVVTDWMMPNLSGLELLEKIKLSDWSAKPGVMFVSAESDSTEVLRAINAGIAGYLRKPLTLDGFKKSLVTFSDKNKIANKDKVT